MFALLILIVVAVVTGYFLGRGKTGERLQNWYAGLRAPKQVESQEDEAVIDEEE
ncbi:MAG: hypothetical protein KAT29_00460 [Anaerolineales bacterium]|nr:hypothetical protein [Anaerolineales bacterium]